ncbi:MAG: hypothetical protein FWF46_08175 [Oscillospiraceae bacterium]|nr:hypothetical protein [Oscillospiraceae bacterium]
MLNNNSSLNQEDTADKKNYNILMKIWRIIYLPMIYFFMPTVIVFIVGFVAGFIYAIHSATNGIIQNDIRRKYI